MQIGFSVRSGMSVCMQPRVMVMVKIQAICQLCGSEILMEDGNEIWTCAHGCPSMVAAILSHYIHVTEVRIDCPECQAHRTIAVNGSDYYECRECHTQFTTSANDEWRKTFLLDERKFDDGFEAFIPVNVLPEKGQGNFPKEEMLQKRLKQVRSVERKMLSALRSMSKWMNGGKPIHFGSEGFSVNPTELFRKLLAENSLV